MANLKQILTKEAKVLEQIEHGQNLVAVSLSKSAKPVRRPPRPSLAGLGGAHRGEGGGRGDAEKFGAARRPPHSLGQVRQGQEVPQVVQGRASSLEGEDAQKHVWFLSGPISSSYLAKNMSTDAPDEVRAKLRQILAAEAEVLEHIEHISHPAAEVEMLKCCCCPSQYPYLCWSSQAGYRTRSCRDTATRTTSAAVLPDLHAHQPAR